MDTIPYLSFGENDCWSFRVEGDGDNVKQWLVEEWLNTQIPGN